MRRTRAQMWVITLLALAAAEGRASDPTIQSVDGLGRLTFSGVTSAVSYRVERAPEATGTWATFSVAAVTLAGGMGAGSGIVTCSLPGYYRIVAAVTNSSLADVPAGSNSGVDPDYGTYTLAASAFVMDATEVTLDKWREVRDWAVSHGYDFENAGSGKDLNHPVHTVNWYDCIKWCNARSEQEGRAPVYYTSGLYTSVYRAGRAPSPGIMATAAGYRLPTAELWRYAARGGVSGRRFPWASSDEIQHGLANYYSYGSAMIAYDTSSTQGFHPFFHIGLAPFTSPAGYFAPNGYGLFDMAGNVSEWCDDWAPGYQGIYRNLCGGSWASGAFKLAVGFAGMAPPEEADSEYGFRTIRMLPP